MIHDFLSQFQSTTLSTLDENNHPFTSYAPVIQDNNHFYVYISDIARHARNLQNNPKCSLFFVEDEAKAENIFARKRIVLQADTTTIDKQSEEYKAVITRFIENFGETMNHLQKMKDFNLYKFTAFHGEAIFGFGKAYDISCQNQLELIERQHQKGHSK